ncbi:helix-turn-helix domain-containing protein [Azospirillum sp. B2RO_4]|uniref:helix-turn-helix domain-containing protein n=1 Tax=Azospirillum sp. B2RO_4 TaxID=3027796 RepID=UPI003DA9DA9D
MTVNPFGGSFSQTAKSEDAVIIELQGEQLRAARALLRWSQQRLAEETSRIHPVSADTIKRWEGIDGAINATSAGVAAVIRTLQAQGIELLNDDSPGARIRRSK